MENTFPTQKSMDRNLILKFAATHPVLSFLVITFSWSWIIWFAVMALPESSGLLRMLVVFVGGYGPAVGGILALRLKTGDNATWSRKRKALMAVSFMVIFGLLSIRYLVGNIAGYEQLPQDLTLNLPIIAAAIIASLTGAWVFSNARSNTPAVREKMGSLIPSRSSWKWGLFSVFFFAAMILVSWGIAAVFGLDVEMPGLWGEPILQVIPLFLLSFALTAVMRGGNEEQGWRGMLQPQLQNKISPLAAALIVAFVWSLWHLPLFLNGFYSGDPLSGMIGEGIYRILLAVFLAWVYNRSGGTLYVMVILHTSFNMMVNFLPTNDMILAVLWLVVVVGVVLKDKMYRKNPALDMGNA